MTLNRRARTLFAIAAAVVGVAAPAVAQRGGPSAARQGANQQLGQQMAQQQAAAQQQQLAQMDQTMQRLHQLETQASKLALNVAQRAGQTGTGRVAAGQIGTRDQSMQQLCDSVANLAGDMNKTMGRIHQNLRDPSLAQDKVMLKDMDRLRLHVEDMAGPLEDALKTMDRMQQRLHVPGSGS